VFVKKTKRRKADLNVKNVVIRTLEISPSALTISRSTMITCTSISLKEWGKVLTKTSWWISLKDKKFKMVYNQSKVLNQNKWKRYFRIGNKKVDSTKVVWISWRNYTYKVNTRRSMRRWLWRAPQRENKVNLCHIHNRVLSKITIMGFRHCLNSNNWGEWLYFLLSISC
jgi:hypothetical protein